MRLKEIKFHTGDGQHKNLRGAKQHEVWEEKAIGYSTCVCFDDSGDNSFSEVLEMKFIV